MERHHGMYLTWHKWMSTWDTCFDKAEHSSLKDEKVYQCIAGKLTAEGL